MGVWGRGQRERREMEGQGDEGEGGREMLRGQGGGEKGHT